MSGQYISGVYTATWNGMELGQTRQGFILIHEHHKRLITSEASADEPIEGVYRGRSQFIEFELMEANRAAIIDLIEPYAAAQYGKSPIGALDVGSTSCPGNAKPLILTPDPTSCAAADADQDPIEFFKTVLAENFPVRAVYSSDLRTFPLRLRAYPDPDNDEEFGTFN